MADLGFAGDCCLAYATLADDPERMQQGALLAQALWNAAVIAYRRAFGTGKAMLADRRSRIRLDREAVANASVLSDAQRAAHVLALDLANQHVAHRVGEQDDARVVALLAPPPDPPEVLGVGVFWVRMAGPEAAQARALAEVCAWLMNAAEPELNVRRQRLLDDLLGKEDLSPYYTAATGS